MYCNWLWAFTKREHDQIHNIKEKNIQQQQINENNKSKNVILILVLVDNRFPTSSFNQTDRTRQSLVASFQSLTVLFDRSM